MDMFSTLLVVLLVGFAAATFAAVAAGAVYMWRAARAARKRHRARSVPCGALGVLFILIPAWFWACVWAHYTVATESLRCKEKLGRQIYGAILAYTLDHPHGNLPPRWVGSGPEPMCGGAGAPASYVYVPVADLGKTAQTTPSQWIACCPKRHRSYWWAPWLRGDDRVVLDALGAVHGLTEEEFQRQRRRQEKARATRPSPK